MTIEHRTEYVNFASSVLDAVNDTMYGVDGVVRLCLVALYTRGHVLLESNPGLGKTALVRTLSDVLRFPFGRIQFTPDLMPSDITGTLMPTAASDAVPLSLRGQLGFNRDGQPADVWGSLTPDDVARGELLAFRPGPVFTSMLLADEINRATPKTQAAMLEAMAERQVTVVGASHRLDSADYVAPYADNTDDDTTASVDPLMLERARKGRPFMVLATQNPIDQEGTYDLPEAQSDRFMFKVLMPQPTPATLTRIMQKTAGVVQRRANSDTPNNGQRDRMAELAQRSAQIEIFEEVREAVRAVPLSAAVEQHILNLYLATNRKVDDIKGLEDADKNKLKETIEPITYGLGPRAATALALGTKAWALFFFEDVGAQNADARALANIVIPVLRHRLKLSYQWRVESEQKYKQVEQDRWLDQYLLELCLATMPDGSAEAQAHRNAFEDVLMQVINGERY